MVRKTYDKQAVAALLDSDWTKLGDWHELRDDGIWVVPPSAEEERYRTPEEREVRASHPAGDLDVPALRFPFTAAEFNAFCESHPMFDWDSIESVYSTKDSDSEPRYLDEVAIAGLARRHKPAAELVRLRLIGAEALGVAPAEPEAKKEKAGERYDRRLLEVLKELGIDPASVQKDEGGDPRRETPKSRARQLAMSPKYGFGTSAFRAAWARLPKGP